jgi:hypothetical protein
MGHIQKENIVPWWRRWRRRSPHCCKPLHCNSELVVRKSQASKDVKTEAEGSTVLETVTRQSVKKQQAEKPYCVLY